MSDKGGKRFVIPEGTFVSAKAGTVLEVELQIKCWRVWGDHGDGSRTGYFHLSKALCEESDVLKVGESVGAVGPKSPRHLHFEVSLVGRHRPQDPAMWLLSKGAVID